MRVAVDISRVQADHGQQFFDSFTYLVAVGQA